jgi:hypothetical protein
MGQKPVITVEDIPNIAFEEVRRGSGAPTHLHSRIYDLFVGVKGEFEIRYEGQHGNGLFVLNPATGERAGTISGRRLLQR